MPLKVGDKCPVCKEGLLERTEIGIACSSCSFDMEIEDMVKANEEQKMQPGADGTYRFKPRTFKITIDDPEAGEEFLRGLIVARSNNSSEYFVDLIDAVNSILEPWRAARLNEELAKRG
jgi:nitrate reductase alpha subunit